MKAKDTLTFTKGKKYAELVAFDPNVAELVKRLLKAQAEISFKAGVREVVDYINHHLNPQVWNSDTNKPYYTIEKSKWQAKLKEWDIKQ